MDSSHPSSFATVLRDTLAELDAAEREEESVVDPLEDFRAAAARALLAGHGGPLPRPGHQAYVQPAQRVTPDTPRALDIRK